MRTVLVTGGAGYIGSHMTALLNEQGYRVIVADNLCTGHARAVAGIPLRVGDLRDGAFLNRLFQEEPIDSVIDFTAYSQVSESMRDPLKYYENNLPCMISLLHAMREHEVKHLVFSSSAAVYGVPEKQPVEESDLTAPVNPYGAGKLAVEELLRWCGQAYGLRYAALRYFNAAGADLHADIGEDHTPETHLIPLALKTALGQRSKIEIFGNDYPTPDGTCVRDYVHVRDLAQAHLLALEYLERGGESGAFNLGSGTGYSVGEILDAARRVTGRDIPVFSGSRRAGDPPVLIASIDKAGRALGWAPSRGIEEILEDAWRWHSTHPDGYGID